MLQMLELRLELLLSVLGSLLATLVIGFLFSRIIRRSLRRYNPLLAEATARYGSWAIYMVGILFSLELLNLKLETILVFVVLIGVLVVIGLRDILPNYFAKQIIDMYKPFNVGDWVKIEEIVGKVVEINDLYTQVVTRSHARVYIPNNLLVKHTISNLSKAGGIDVTARISVPLSRSLDDIISTIEKAISEEAREEGTGDSEIQVVSLNAKTVELEVKVRILNPQRVEDVRSRVLRKIYRALETELKG